MRFNSKDKKSVLTAAFVCICAAAALAGVASYGSSALDKQKSEEAEYQAYQPPKTREVLINKTPKTDLEDTDGANGEKPKDADVKPSAQSKENNKQKEAPKQTEQTKPESAKAEQAKPEVKKAPENAQETGALDDKLFLMPVSGEIVMDYSADIPVFDSTLEQYRTTDGVAISAEKGEEVMAAADGTVKEIFNDNVMGTTVVLSHDGGRETTYGQLESEVAVSVGDAVKAGEVIATVAAPTKYGVALGDHIDFKVSQNGETIDPKSVLKQN